MTEQRLNFQGSPSLNSSYGLESSWTRLGPHGGASVTLKESWKSSLPDAGTCLHDLSQGHWIHPTSLHLLAVSHWGNRGSTGRRNAVAWRLAEDGRSGVGQQASMSDSHRRIDTAQLLYGKGAHTAVVKLLPGHNVEWPDKRDDACHERLVVCAWHVGILRDLRGVPVKLEVEMQRSVDIWRITESAMDFCVLSGVLKRPSFCTTIWLTSIRSVRQLFQPSASQGLG